jgi:CheY-like chemotaxis protein
MDAGQVDQILANLMINARDAIKKSGKVIIETENVVFDEAYCSDHAGFIPGNYILLSVQDNGCGMDRETIANIFEPFFTTKETDKGTGLGLSTVYGIVKQNNGMINVDSVPEKETTFRIYLPRFTGNDTQISVAPQVKALRTGTETVLLVEDEPLVLKTTQVMLENLGYKVLTATTPAEATRLADTYNSEIDLLITDVVMPEMNGRDLAKQIFPNLRVLFMSGYTADVIAHHCVLDEGIHMLQKPFSIKDLAAKVRNLLDL